MSSHRITLAIALKLKTELYYCPLCDNGAHVHVVAWMGDGPAIFDMWISPDRAPTDPDCVAWCLEHGEPADLKESKELRFGDMDAWRGEETPDADCCADSECGEDFDCDICLRCPEHCGC